LPGGGWSLEIFQGPVAKDRGKSVGIEGIPTGIYPDPSHKSNKGDLYPLRCGKEVYSSQGSGHANGKESHLPDLPPVRRRSFFLTEKKTGDWRPIINLKPLNQFIRPVRFRMESLSTVLKADIKGKWATTLDLKDAYLHVPIHPNHFRWLRFMIDGRSVCPQRREFSLEL
jgi:hypothetical protein